MLKIKDGRGGNRGLKGHPILETLGGDSNKIKDGRGGNRTPFCRDLLRENWSRPFYHYTTHPDDVTLDDS